MAEAAPIKTSSAKVSKEEQLAAAIKHRIEQRQHAYAAKSQLEEALQDIRAKTPVHVRFISHVTGFYDEVDKLAKGKALLSATDMIVENANSIVRDAKAIIDGDVYVDRLKEFVPAGDNPVYPDILMVARTIQQANDRFTKTLESRRKELAGTIREAATIGDALQLFIENRGHIASKQEIARATESWFEFDDDAEDGPHFNFERLDTLNISEHLTAVLTAPDAHE